MPGTRGPLWPSCPPTSPTARSPTRSTISPVRCCRAADRSLSRLSAAVSPKAESRVSVRHPIAQEDHPAVEPALVEQLEPRVDVVRQRSLATADENRHEQQLQLVDQARSDRLTAEIGTADGDVRNRALLHPLDRLGVELALDTRL